MATLQSDEANILDAETINWRLIIYPILAGLIVVVGAFGYYYYQLNQREQREATARVDLLQAKTPDAFLKVAQQYPNTDQATLALLSAADASSDKRDYAGAISALQQIIQSPTANPELRDNAELNLASAQEASGKPADAINSYLDVARRAEKSPYSPYAYYAAYHLYEIQNDKDMEREILTEGAGMDADSVFVKQMQQKLKELTQASQPPPVPTIPVPTAGAPAPVPAATPAAPNLPAPAAPTAATPPSK